MDRRQMLKAGLTAVAAGTLVGSTSEEAEACGCCSGHLACCDCVYNPLYSPVIVHILSNHGRTILHVGAGRRAYFRYVNDGNMKVLAAYSYDNRLVTTYPFYAIPNPGPHNWLVIRQDVYGTQEYLKRG